MKGPWMGMALVGALVIGGPDAAGAQVRSVEGGWWEWAAPTSAGGQEVSTPRGVVVVPQPRGGRGVDADRSGRPVQAGGPPFCRNGQGHPKHGRQWCMDKGWGLGGRRPVLWEQRRWEDVVLRVPGGRRSVMLDEGTLIDALGEVVFGRVQEQRRRLGAGGPIVGRWVDADIAGGHVLQLRSGSTPLVELSDLDGDGMVDLVLLYRGN